MWGRSCLWQKRLPLSSLAPICADAHSLHHQRQTLHSWHASHALHGCAGDDTDDSIICWARQQHVNMLYIQDTDAAEMLSTMQHCYDLNAQAGSSQRIGGAPKAQLVDGAPTASH